MSTTRRLPFDGVPSGMRATQPTSATPSPSPTEGAPPLYRDPAPASPATTVDPQQLSPTPVPTPPPALVSQSTLGRVHVPGEGSPLPAGVVVTQPPRKRSAWKVVLGILLPLLIIGGGAGVWWWMVNRDTPEKAVKGYLSALVRGDADGALSYADTSVDGTFLTDDALRQLADTGGGVGPITAQKDAQATFTVAGNPVTVTYRTSEANGVVRLPVSVKTTIKSTVPVTLLGKQVFGDVQLFPGQYTLGAVSPNVAVHQKFMVVDPSVPVVVKPEIKLSPTGVEAARAAVAADLKRCLESKQLAPKSCPFQLKQPSNGTINESSITYSLVSPDPVPQAAFVWDPSTSRAKAPLSLKIKLIATGVLADGTGTGDVAQELELRPTVYVDVVKDQPVVTWG